MEWTDTALVLQVGGLRETDLWVRMLAREKGLLTAFAFGASRSRRRFAGCLDSFNLLRVRASLSRSGMFINLQEATLLRGPEHLRRDWRRQGVAVNCIRFMEALGVPPDGAGSHFELMKGVLDALDKPEALPAIFPLLFRFRLASEQGYAPDLTCCAHCGKPFDAGGAFFLVREGIACCPACCPSGGMALRIGPEALDVLRKVQEYSPDLWRDAGLSPENGRQAARLIDAFVRYHLGLEWAQGRFRPL